MTARRRRARRLVPALLALAALLAAWTLTGPASSARADDPEAQLAAVTAQPAERLVQRDDGSAPVRAVARVVLTGRGFFGTSYGPTVHFTAPDGREVPAPLVILRDERTVEAWLPEGLSGRLGVTLVNGDRQALRATLDV